MHAIYALIVAMIFTASQKARRQKLLESPNRVVVVPRHPQSPGRVRAFGSAAQVEKSHTNPTARTACFENILNGLMFTACVLCVYVFLNSPRVSH